MFVRSISQQYIYTQKTTLNLLTWSTDAYAKEKKTGTILSWVNMMLFRHGALASKAALCLMEEGFVAVCVAYVDCVVIFSVEVRSSEEILGAKTRSFHHGI